MTLSDLPGLEQIRPVRLHAQSRVFFCHGILQLCNTVKDGRVICCRLFSCGFSRCRGASIIRLNLLSGTSWLLVPQQDITWACGGICFSRVDCHGASNVWKWG